MNEYSRILIEQYCMEHNSRKGRRLARLVDMSYDSDRFWLYQMEKEKETRIWWIRLKIF